jgi:hypothetical protein
MYPTAPCSTGNLTIVTIVSSPATRIYSVQNLNILGWGLSRLDLIEEPSTLCSEKEADGAAEA